MKNFKISIACLAMFTMIFTSCSKEESDVSGLDGQDTYQLQFNANLNDFNKQQDTSSDPVECREAAPAYVLVALTDSNDEWVADKNPEAPGADAGDFIKINLKNNNGSWETEYSDELGLPAGTYQLEYFIVYSADDEVLWVAPRAGSAYASSVSDPLPQQIVLGAGTKPYIEVDVLCYIPREEAAFGYIFFDINLIIVENGYCIFVNYCDDQTGREYPALFEVDVWGDAFGGSEVIVDGEMNSVSGAGNSFAATVLCLPLPPLGDGELYYVRVTVLDAGAYNAGASDFYEFTITQADIMGQPSLEPAYRHVRINCGDNDNGNECETDPTGPDCDPDNDNLTNAEEEALGTDPNNPDTDGDDIRDDLDQCPTTEVLEGQVDPDGDGCWTTPNGGYTCTGTPLNFGSLGDCQFAYINGQENFFQINGDNPLFLNYSGGGGGDALGPLTVYIDDNDDLYVETDLSGITNQIHGYEVIVTDNATFCETLSVDLRTTPEQIGATFSNVVELSGTVNYPVYVKLKVLICPSTL